jgi:anti-sigma factor RsiW
MTEGLRDALPDLLNGKLNELDTATLTAHVESCAECRTELALLREVKTAGAIVPAINVAAIASRIAPYGGSEAAKNVQPKPSAYQWAWKLAAGAAIVALVIFGVARNMVNAPGKSVAVTAALPAVASQPAVVETPAPGSSVTPTNDAVTTEREVASLYLVGNIQDLSDSEIAQLLTDLDGIETLPAAEPQSVTSSLDDAGAEQ